MNRVYKDQMEAMLGNTLRMSHEKQELSQK